MEIEQAGWYFKNVFGNDSKYFDSVTKAHKFQNLTESDKPGQSYRTGIYLSNVENTKQGKEFNLMRCSTNFIGPTEQFVDCDHEIIEKVNKIAHEKYPDAPNLNHVLAQVYNNSVINGKEKKARIKGHSDKTKDMPDNGIIAFVTFYDQPVENEMAMCKLRFKSKGDTKKDFQVLLEPGSVFVIDLETNRQYTHEISPSLLNVDKSPTRLGYVIRCSNTKAVYKDNKVFIVDNDKLEELQKPTMDNRKYIKNKYFDENSKVSKVCYDFINFSLNEGDYLEPISHSD